MRCIWLIGAAPGQSLCVEPFRSVPVNPPELHTHNYQSFMHAPFNQPNEQRQSQIVTDWLICSGDLSKTDLAFSFCMWTDKCASPQPPPPPAGSIRRQNIYSRLTIGCRRVNLPAFSCCQLNEEKSQKSAARCHWRVRSAHFNYGPTKMCSVLWKMLICFNEKQIFTLHIM